MSSELTPVPDDLEFDATIQGLNASQRIFGRYVLRRILGRGGMGIVWLGYDERLDREVALKFLPEAVNFDPVARDDLMRETRRCLDLTHPNIIRIYDFVNDPQAAAISMEYINGKTLAALRVEKEPRIFEVNEIKGWIANTCAALQYAHEEVSVVHRDLKPGNLMLTSRGQVKIADFGISRSVSDTLSRVTVPRGTSGTLAYMSPQQLNGDLPRISDDIYALGATIYELLTSRPPFYSGDIPFQVRLMVPKSMKVRRKELEISGADIPSEWEEVVAACLSKIPDERPGCMSEIAERLGLTGAPPRAPLKRKAGPTGGIKGAFRRLWPEGIVPLWFRVRQVSPRNWIQWAGGFVTLLLACWLVWHYVLWPFVAVPGDLEVSSSPAGATVHVAGRAEQPTPAVFPSLRVGHYSVSISADGFYPVRQDVTITEGIKVNLGTIALQRAYGNLQLTTLPAPAHYTLDGDANTGGYEKDGSTPDFISSLPSGSYRVTWAQANLPKHVETLIVPPDQTLLVNRDLIRLTLLDTVAGNLAEVFAGNPGSGPLDAVSHAQLVQLHLKAFHRYLGAGLLPLAFGELTNLNALGVDTASNQQALADKRAATERDFAEQIHDLLDDKKFATAAERLEKSKSTLELESVNRLNALFGPSFRQYQQEVASEMSITGTVASRYDQMKVIAARHPDDLQPQLGLAYLQEQMPPNHEQLSGQLKSLRLFAGPTSDFATDPELISLLGAFSDELRQLDSFADALARAKNGPPAVQDELDSLEAQKATLIRRHIVENRSNPLSDTLNFLGKAVAGHSVVNTDSGFSSQREKDEAIAAIQARIDVAQLELARPKIGIDEIQKQYDAFVARVPWGTAVGK